MEQCQQSLNDIKPLFDKLQHQWEIYLNSNEDTDIKKNSLEQFLYNFQFVDKKVLQNEEFKNFFNTIPEEICSYFLELVNEIINQSDLFSTGNINNVFDDPTTQKENGIKQENLKFLKKHHNFAQLVLKTPGDCNKIIALRTFLTHQLGQHLLNFLLDVDFKLITSQKSLCNLCINLFPNCTWTETICELKKSLSLNDILSNFYFHHNKVKAKIFQQQNNDENFQSLPNGNVNWDEYNGGAKDIEKFRLEKKTSDEIALILIRLLKKCIVQENDAILTEQSMTIIALNFALNSLQSSNDDINYASPHNAEIIKSELLHLIQMCCNNLFIDTENVNAVQFPIIFAKLNEALIINERKCTDITCVLIFLILSILYNVTAIYGNQPRYNNCKNLFKSQQFIDKNVIEMCMGILQKLSQEKEISQALFGHIFKTLLRITDQLSKCEKPKHNHNSEVQQRSTLRKKHNLKHSHCNPSMKDISSHQPANNTSQVQGTEHELLSCFFQKTLLLILPSLSLDLQEQAMRYFLKSGVCCCHYTLTSYKNILEVALSIGANYQRCAYKFLQRFILSGIFLRNPNVVLRKRHDNSNCLSCDDKFKSRDFQDGLLRLYIEMHEKLVANNDFTALEIFLKHLKRISHLLPYDIASGILAEIVLPIFRTWKLKIVIPVSEKSSANTTPSKSVGSSFWLTKTKTPNTSPTSSNNSPNAGTPTSPGKRLLLNVSAAQQEAAALEQQQFTLSITNECLNIFAMYLCDIRLVKAFYNEENIKHLEDLLSEPELIRGICDLIKIGIDNITFLGDNNQEQMALSRRLINLQLNSSDRAAQLFTQLLQRIDKTSNNLHLHNNNNNNNKKPKFWLDGCNNDNKNDFIINNTNNNNKKKLNILHILHITALQWSLNYDLLKTSQLFYNEFAKTYSIVQDDLPLDDNNIQADEQNSQISNNLKATATATAAAAAIAEEEHHHHHPNFLKHGDKTIIDILKLNYNALSCFLMLPDSQKLNTNTNNIHYSPAKVASLQNQENKIEENPSTTSIPKEIAILPLPLPLPTLHLANKSLMKSNLSNSFQPWKTINENASNKRAERTEQSERAEYMLPLLAFGNIDSTITNNTFATTISNTYTNPTITTRNTLMEYNTIDCCFSKALENAYKLESLNFSTKAAFTPVTLPINYHHFANTSIDFSLNSSFDTESFTTDITSTTATSFSNDSFLQKLQTSIPNQVIKNPVNEDSNSWNEESIVIFDIRNQSKSILTPSTSTGTTPFASLPTPEEEYLLNGQPFKDYINTLPDIHHSTINTNHSSATTPGSLIGNIVNIFGWLFGGSPTNNSQSLNDLNTPKDTSSPEDKEFQEQISCLYQINGDCKKLLLKLFEATMAICVKGYQNEEVEKMQKHLRKLKAVILGSASANWQQHAEEQTRDNIIIQTLQTLLKIAELSTTLNEPAEVISGSLVNTPTDDERLPIHMQPRSMRCSQLICPPVLPAVNAVATPPTPRRPLSGESADADYFSTRASLICADSELEFSDNNDDFYLTADEGYEADGEVPDATDTDGDCIEAVDIWNALQPASRYRTHILHDGLCRLVIEILIELSTICIQNPKGWCDSLAQLANRLFIIRDYLGGPLFLLKGFKPILECNDPKLKELQQSLLELIGDLNTPEVLTTFFSIISSKKAPVDILIKYMHFICTNTLRKPQPYYELEFPICPDGKCVSTSDSFVTEQIDRMRTYHMQCQANTPLTRAPLIIPVTHAKLWGNEGFTTSLWFNVKGANQSQKATSQVIEEDSRSSNDDCLKTHIVSLGTNQAMISVYINNNMNLIFEICKPNAEVQIHVHNNATDCSMHSPYNQQNDKKNSSSSSQTRNQTVRNESTISNASPFRNALKQTKLALFQSFSQMHLFNGQPTEYDPHFEVSYVDLKHCRITRNKWTHLGFAVETLQDRLDVFIYIDGLERRVISLPFKNIRNLIRNYTFQIVALGDGAIAKSPNTSSYTDSRSTLDSHPIRLTLTNFMLFNRKINLPECFFTLTAMGPDFTEFSQCQVGNWKPNYGYLNLTRMPKANFGNLKESMRSLKHARILSYTAQQPDFVMCYKSNQETEGNFEGSSCGLILYSKLVQNELSSIQTAVILSGGLSTLLYLFARVVEATNNSLTQSMALDMLLRISMSESQLFTEFICNDYINLIGFVIKSDRCTKDVNLLKSIINNACTHQVISKKGDVLHVNDNTIASIIHPRIIISVLHRYSDWHRSGVENSKVLEMIFSCIIALTREKHPHREFNMEQLNKVNLLRELINICKVYVIESPNPVYISKEAASYFVKILAVFADSPPTPSLLDEIMKLLLLLHKPSDCFVTHDRGNLYFLLTSVVPAKEKSLSGVNLSRVAAPFRRNLIKDRPGSALPIKNSNFTNLTTSNGNDSDKERLARIQRLRRFHSNDYPSYKRPVHELEENLENIADCSKLNKGALRLLNPLEAKRCHSKLKRKIAASCNLSSPKKINSVTKDRIKSIAVLTPIQTNITPALQSKVTRKRLRSTNSLRYSESEKRMKKDRNSKSSMHSISLMLTNFGGEMSSTISDVFSSSTTTRRPRYMVKTDLYKYEGIIALQESLFLKLKDFICLLSDATVDEVLRHYVKVEYLLVLANHSDCSVRTAIIKLLATLTQRLPASDINAFSKNLYPQHLGNQLAVHPTDQHMFEACLTWLTGIYGNIETFLHVDNIQIHQRFGLNALLSILSKSTLQQNDFAELAFKIFQRIYTKNPDEHQALYEAGLLQACMKALYNLHTQTPTIYNAKTEDSIINLLTIIGERSLKSVGQIHIVWEILNLLSFYQTKQPMTIIKSFRSVQGLLQLNWITMFFVKTNVPWNFKVSPLPNCQLNLTEIKTRLDLLVDRCSQFFTVFDANYVPSSNEIHLFELLVSYCISCNQRCINFIAWGLLPSRPRDLRAFIIDALWISCQDDFSPPIICDGKMIKSLLWLSLHEDLDKPIANLSNLCKHLGITENDSTWNLENELENIEFNRSKISAKQKALLEKAVYKFESLAQNCVETSLIITRRVAELQNAERKLLMSYMKDYDDTLTYTQWVDITKRLTHEGAPWYNDIYAETSWELDDTEGPSRVHTRLKRCHLDIDKRFFMEDYTGDLTSSVSKNKTLMLSETLREMPMESSSISLTSNTNMNVQEYTRPLEYLISSYEQQLNISLNSPINYNFPAKYLPVDEEIDGEIIITDNKLYFFATYRCKYFYINCDIANIAEIWPKRYQHQEKAFEIFLDTNRSLFFSLQSQDDYKKMCEIFCNKIMGTNDQIKLSAITQQWRDGQLTNWEYLMTLNQIAGRTYNDLMQYPVFPWILNNYNDHVLDLTEPKNFRKLEKPIAVQNPENEQHYISNYMHMSNTETNMGSLNLKPYHYSSHYSNSGTVLHFLVRVPPFTSYFLRYQDNNFDLPDRTFHALNTTWCLASRDSPTDVKELIPEFFCLPEMFENFEHFNFGCRQNGERVENVSLPPWCSNDARLFILIHRQALESELVRNMMHNWIDLIFGYKQTGENAVEAVNVFHPATYPTFLESQISDPIQREAVETMVKTLGQMPRQLFKAPHPSSKPLTYTTMEDKRVIPTVHGLRWGIYVGSPQLPPPVLNPSHRLPDADYLISFSNTNVVYGLSSKRGIMQGAEPDTYNVISWGHEDRIVRIEPLNKAQARPRNLLYNNAFDDITACGCDPNSNQLWFGHKSGRISVYKCNGMAGDSNNWQNKSRQSYVKTLKFSYNSAIRKITTKSGNKMDPDLDCEIQNPSLSSSASSTTLSGTLGNTEALQRDGADLTWIGPIVLIRHTDEITCITLSVEYKIAVSAGRDGIAIIWDLNNWNYVRTIDRPAEIHLSPITLVAISPTLGDIVTVHSILNHPQQQQNSNTYPLNDNAQNSQNNFINRDYTETPTSSTSNVADECFEVTEDLDDFVNVSMNLNGKSILRLHSVNGRYVQHMVLDERILDVCYSYVKEGVGVNVIATAIEGGIVRLWSSWNLSFVTEILTGTSNIKSLIYSTHQHLVVLTKESYIQVWETEGLSGNTPKFPQNQYKKSI